VTFYPVDADTLADDYPFGFQLRYGVDNARACVDDRQPCGSHAYVGTVAKELPTFSTSSDRWRNVPIIWYPEEGVATLTARVRLSVATVAGSMRLRIGERVGSTVALSTGTNQTATATIDVSGLGLSSRTPSQTPIVVGLEFLSGRAAALTDPVELVGTLNGRQLAINDPQSVFGGATGPLAGHYEITLSESAATPFAHVQSVIQADQHADFDFDLWIDRDIGGDSAFRQFFGEAPQTAGPDELLYPLTQFSIKGWELEAEGDGASLFETQRRAVGSGQGAQARTVNSISVIAQDAVARTMRWLACAPIAPGGYGIGARVADATDTAIGGAIVTYRADAIGFDVALAYIASPTDGEGVDVSREFEIEVENLTAGGTTSFATTLAQDSRTARSTGYAYGVGATASSTAVEDWSSLDLGLPGDLELLRVHRFTAGLVTLPADGDRLLVRIMSNDGNVAVPCLLVRERFA